jgi:hypothetical protein
VFRRVRKLRGRIVRTIRVNIDGEHTELELKQELRIDRKSAIQQIKKFKDRAKELLFHVTNEVSVTKPSLFSSSGFDTPWQDVSFDWSEREDDQYVHYCVCWFDESFKSYCHHAGLKTMPRVESVADASGRPRLWLRLEV